MESQSVIFMPLLLLLDIQLQLEHCWCDWHIYVCCLIVQWTCIAHEYAASMLVCKTASAHLA